MLQKITDQNHDEKIASAAMAVLDFQSAWCATCAHLERILEEIDQAQGGRILMGKVDIVDSPDVTLKYGVLGVPTVILLRDGEPVHHATFTSSVSKEKISQLIERHFGI